MLLKIGKLIEQKPWLVISVILLITVGFGIFIPTLEMETSMEHFLPDDEVVVANDRINEYFGADFEVVMIYVEIQNAASSVSPQSLREIYLITKELEQIEEVEGSMSVAGFVDTLCQMEFGKTLEYCTDEEVQRAFDDLLAQKTTTEIKMMTIDDPNEDIDIFTRPRLSKGKSIDSIDIKNYYLESNNETYCFSIEVHDLSTLESDITPPLKKMNVMEWYIDFENLINPYEEMDINYSIAAHIEPTSHLWEIGKRPLKNLREILSLIRNRDLFNSYQVEALLWIQPPGQDISFPLVLETGNVTFNKASNRVEIRVDKRELGQYGIAPEMNGFGLPGRIGNTKAGVRYYQLPGLMSPWQRISFNMNFIQNSMERLQKRPILGSIFERMLSRSGDFSIDALLNMSSMMGEEDVGIDSISLKDMSMWWVTTDEAPDNDLSTSSIFIKPSFLDEMGTNLKTFVTEDFEVTRISDATLVMVQINGSLSLGELSQVSTKVVDVLAEEDAKQPYVSMMATGNSIMENEINEVMMDANQIIIPLIFIVISIILLFSFRKISYVVLPLLGLSIAIVWLFGTMAIFQVPFMIMEVALIPMLMGLGVDYSVHLFHNYRTELAKGNTPGKAIVASIQDIGIAMLLATITTFIAFLSFLSATVIPLRDFGVLTAIGIVYVFIITITFQAAVRYILDRRKKSLVKIRPKKDPTSKIMKKTAKIVCTHPVPILLVTILITAIMISGALQIQTGFEMEDFLPEENPSVTVMMDIAEDFPFSSQEKEYVLIEGDVGTVDTLEGIYRFHQNVGDDIYVLIDIEEEPKVESILTLIQNEMEKNISFANEFNLDYRGIPSSDVEVQQLFNYLFEDDAMSFEVQELLHKEDSNYDATLITIYTAVTTSNNVDLNNAMETVYTDLNDDIKDSFDKANAVVTGENSMMHVIMNSMTESQILSSGICLVFAAIVLIIAYRRPTLGLITMIPVLISTVWIIGSMHFIGYSLNVMTVMITSMTIGLGITYAIHAVERFRLVADRTGDVIEAVSETIGHTGSALTIAAITTMAGFGLLIFTPMPIEQQFGVITALTILYALLTSLFILPPILMFWGKWRKKKGYIISPGPSKRK